MDPALALYWTWRHTVRTSEQVQADFERALRTMDEFAAGEAPVQKAARKIARALDELGIPYAVAGALAVAANGLERQTVDVDLILTKEGLAALKERWLGSRAFPAARVGGGSGSSASSGRSAGVAWASSTKPSRSRSAAAWRSRCCPSWP
jgi:hypothetical protein